MFTERLLHVTLGISREDFQLISDAPSIPTPPFNRREEAVWIQPNLVCTVQYMATPPDSAFAYKYIPTLAQTNQLVSLKKEHWNESE